MLAGGKKRLVSINQRKSNHKAIKNIPLYTTWVDTVITGKPLSIYFRSNSKGRQLCLNKYWLNHYFPIAWGCEHDLSRAGPAQPGYATVVCTRLVCILSMRRRQKKGRSKSEIRDTASAMCGIGTIQFLMVYFIFFVLFARLGRSSNGWWNWNFITAPRLIQCANGQIRISEQIKRRKKKRRKE